VILPIARGRVLLHLRDLKPGINAPGHWGFLGGAISPGEKSRDAARRELLEEVGYAAGRLHWLGRKRLPEVGGVVCYAYCCALDTPVNKLHLMEGLDFGLKSARQIASKSIYSRRMGRRFPVVVPEYTERLLRKAVSILSGTAGRSKRS